MIYVSEAGCPVIKDNLQGLFQQTGKSLLVRIECKGDFPLTGIRLNIKQ